MVLNPGLGWTCLSCVHRFRLEAKVQRSQYEAVAERLTAKCVKKELSRALFAYLKMYESVKACWLKYHLLGNASQWFASFIFLLFLSFADRVLSVSQSSGRGSHTSCECLAPADLEQFQEWAWETWGATEHPDKCRQSMLNTLQNAWMLCCYVIFVLLCFFIYLKKKTVEPDKSRHATDWYCLDKTKRKGEWDSVDAFNWLFALLYNVTNYSHAYVIIVYYMLRLHQQYSLFSPVAVMKSFPIDFSPTRGGACIIGSTVSTGLQRWTRSGLPDLIDGPFLNFQKHIGLEWKMQLIASQAWLPGKWCCPCYHLGSCILLCCTLFTGQWNALNDIEMHISAHANRAKWSHW